LVALVVVELVFVDELVDQSRLHEHPHNFIQIVDVFVPTFGEFVAKVVIRMLARILNVHIQLIRLNDQLRAYDLEDIFELILVRFLIRCLYIVCFIYFRVKDRHLVEQRNQLNIINVYID